LRGTIDEGVANGRIDRRADISVHASQARCFCSEDCSGARKTAAASSLIRVNVAGPLPWENVCMMAIRFLLCGAVVVAFSAPVPAFAQQSAHTTISQQSVQMTVSARVEAQCLIEVQQAQAPDDGQAPGVRVVCGRTAVRHLRVTSDRHGSLRPTVMASAQQMVAAEEVFYSMAQPMAALASLEPVLPPAAPIDDQPVTVTLDF
jgi:hypothetical protein